MMIITTYTSNVMRICNINEIAGMRIFASNVYVIFTNVEKKHKLNTYIILAYMPVFDSPFISDNEIRYH